MQAFILIGLSLLLIGCSSSNKVDQDRDISNKTKKENPAAHVSPKPPQKIDGMLLGEFDVGDINTPEFPWFAKNFNLYDPDQSQFVKLIRNLRDVKILCFAGTWCTDTQRELPRMLRILQEIQADPEMMTMIGIDRNKMSTDGSAAEYKITFSPTFIFLRDGKEIGRIEESPKKSLELDMVDLCKKEK